MVELLLTKGSGVTGAVAVAHVACVRIRGVNALCPVKARGLRTGGGRQRTSAACEPRSAHAVGRGIGLLGRIISPEKKFHEQTSTILPEEGITRHSDRRDHNRLGRPLNSRLPNLCLESAKA